MLFSCSVDFATTLPLQHHLLLWNVKQENKADRLLKGIWDCLIIYGVLGPLTLVRQVLTDIKAGKRQDERSLFSEECCWFFSQFSYTSFRFTLSQTRRVPIRFCRLMQIDALTSRLVLQRIPVSSFSEYDAEKRWSLIRYVFTQSLAFWWDFHVSRLSAEKDKEGVSIPQNFVVLWLSF
jgi:hypothetical protein